MKERNHILDSLFRDPMLNEILHNITGGHHLMPDLKTELFLILLELDEKKLIIAYEGKWLLYLCINIIKKMWNSKTSPFFKKYKKIMSSEDIQNWLKINDIEDFDLETFDLVIDIVNKLPFVEKELFYMRYKIGKYDRYFGERRDEECKKPVSSFRKMEKKLSINEVSIDHNTIQVYHKKTINKIKKILNGK